MKNGMEITSNGNRYWYRKGKLHREDGPAVEWWDGDEEWYLNGKRHRTDGPAVIRANGTKWWYLNGGWYTFDKWLEVVNISEQEKIFLKLKWA